MIFEDYYNNSWALCIGINNYLKASPLEYAVNDAKEIAKILIKDIGFDEDKVILLTDENSTRNKILKSFLSYSNLCERNDRVIVFFAGHGHTFIGNHGEIGYLIPYDGDIDDLSSLLRWDDLTRNADLIPAKHIFFLLDACFSGLAITRSLPKGSMRFLKDMLQRYSRQVIAAGKANQSVSDANGPIPGHSIFTGYLINGLKGDAKSTNGIITANGLMSYVYQKVANDNKSMQTPHYGFFDGDGDFIINYNNNEKRDEESSKFDNDTLFEIPIEPYHPIENSSFGFLDRVKEYLSDTKYKIRLDDLLITETKKLLSLLNKDTFELKNVSDEEEKTREILKIHEEISSTLRTMILAISYWGEYYQKKSVYKILSRLSDHLSINQLANNWIPLRWYPIMLLLYSIGIPYLIHEDYEALFKLFTLPVVPFKESDYGDSLIISYGYSYIEINGENQIKKLKEHKRNYVPFNEYLFKSIHPFMEDILFLGSNYENVFDKLEIIIGLTIADIQGNTQFGDYWGPLGRYAWKYRQNRFRKNDPFSVLKAQAFIQKENSPLLRAGFFNSTYARMEKTFNEFENFLINLPWH